MPTFTPAAKIEATKSYGAEVVIHGSEYDEFHQRAMEIADTQNLNFIHPFNDPEISPGKALSD